MFFLNAAITNLAILKWPDTDKPTIIGLEIDINNKTPKELYIHVCVHICVFFYFYNMNMHKLHYSYPTVEHIPSSKF